MSMKGQASLEYLLLAVAALAMVGLSAIFLKGLESSSRSGADALRFRHDGSMLKNAISEVCALGDGNGRELSLEREISTESAKSPEGWAIRLSSGDLSMAFVSRCPLDAEKMEDTVYVKNEKGTVSVRGR